MKNDFKPVVGHRFNQQSDFLADQPQYYQGAQGGWQRFLAGLEQLLARMD